MKIEEILNYVSIAVSDINFMIAMLVIVLVSACFLGRYVVITRKMLIATCGVLVFQVLFIIVGSIIMTKFFPDEVAIMENMDVTDTITQDNPNFNKIYLISLVYSFALNAGVFIYAFVFYLISNKEKKLLRAIESTVCLYLYTTYENTVAQYTYIYVRGGDYKMMDPSKYEVGGVDTIYFTLANVGFDFVVSLLLLLVLYFGYFKKKRFYILRIRDRILFVVWLVVFACFPAFPLAGDNDSERFKILCYVFGALIPILGGLAPILLSMNAAERNLKEKNEYQESYLNAELEYIERYKNTQTETRAFRHDIINNLSLTNMMLDEGKVEEASAHLKELLGNVRALSPSIITGDEMLDCIVAMKADKMRELQIDFKSDGVVDGGLNMKPMDICSIFANAIDNAIEASSKTLPEAWVELNIKRTEKFFIVKISNSACEKVDVEKLFMSAGYTSKKDTEHHGFGLRNIRRTVEEYDGLVKAESDESSFGLSIMIPRKSSV